MINFLYGQDTYRSREELRRIVEEYKKVNPDWLDFIRIDVNDSTSGPGGLKAQRETEFFEQVCRSTDTISMFNQKKLIIIENVFSPRQARSEFQDEILEFIKKKDLKDIEIIFWEGDESLPRTQLRGTKLFKFLQKNFKEFLPLKGNQLKSWIKEYIEEQKGKIENPAVDKLIEYVGSDLWRMSNEINKLITYKIQATRYEIQVKDIELLIKPEIDLNIFHLVDALGYKNKDKALKLFKELLGKGEDENYLLSMFIYQIRNLLKIKSGGGEDLHPFVFRKAQQQVKNFDWDDLKKIYHQLMTIDLEIKTGKTDSKTALEVFLATF